MNTRSGPHPRPIESQSIQIYSSPFFSFFVKEDASSGVPFSHRDREIPYPFLQDPSDDLQYLPNDRPSQVFFIFIATYL